MRICKKLQRQSVLLYVVQVLWLPRAFPDIQMKNAPGRCRDFGSAAPDPLHDGWERVHSKDISLPGIEGCCCDAVSLNGKHLTIIVTSLNPPVADQDTPSPLRDQKCDHPVVIFPRGIAGLELQYDNVRHVEIVAVSHPAVVLRVSKTPKSSPGEQLLTHLRISSSGIPSTM